MAKITDPDQLNQATEVVFDRGARTIQLLVAGNLDDTSPGATSGVTGQALYSFCKEEWKDDTDLNKQPFPLFAVTETQLQWINGWSPADLQTRQLIRDAGWTESVGAENGDVYAGFVSLGNFDSTSDQAYYVQSSGYASTDKANYDKTGNLNEALLVNDADGSNFLLYKKAFLRIQGKTYDEYNLLVEQNLSTLQNRLYQFPLSNGADVNVTENDTTLSTLTPYTGMTVSFLQGTGFTTYATSTVYPAGAVVLDPNVQASGSSNGTWWFTPAGGTSNGANTGVDTGITDWESYSGEEQIGTEWFAYNVVIDGNNGTANEIYQRMQWELRQTSDINDDLVGSPNQDGYGVVNGDLSKLLLAYQGDLITEPGVLIRNFDTNDTNSIQFQDITVDGGGVDAITGNPVTTTARTFPFVAAGNLNFSANLVSETNADTYYTMYFTYIDTITETTLGITGASGQTATLDNTGGTDLTTILTTNDWLTLSGFANAENNGRWEVTGAVTATTAALTKSGDAPTNETATPSVTLNTNPFGTDGAIIVDDNSVVDISGTVSTTPVSFDFDYDNNTQGGRTAGTDAPVTIVASGLNDSQWVSISETITANTGLSFTVTSQDELNYSNV